jgi:hypothetical protein
MRLLRPFLALLVLSTAARAQSGGSAPWSILSIRYDTRTSDFIYAVYGYGRVFAMAAVLDNPRSGYTEVLGGLGTRFSVGGGPTQFTAGAVARVGDAWYAQLYYLPTLHTGPVTTRATAEAYIPISGPGTVSQFALSPISATVAASKRLEAGVGMDLAAASQDRTSTAIGPELRLALPNATLILDAQHALDRAASRLRLSFLAAF